MTTRIEKLAQTYETELYGISRAHDIPLPTILAVLQVETNDDDGFSRLTDGTNRMIIRFELHKFKKYCREDTWQRVSSQFRWDADKPWTGQQFRMWNEEVFKTFHGNQTNEHFVLSTCREMDTHAAFMSISMGLPQVMGFNYASMDYLSAIDMFNDFNQGTINQIEGMMKFMGKSMKKRLRERRFVDFAYMYNGRGKAEDYGKKIRVAEGEIAGWLGG